MCHIISIKEAHHQHGGGVQYGGGYAVQIRHIISMDEGVQYKTTKTAQGVDGGCSYLGQMILYKHCYYSLDSILLWLYPDVAEIPLGCQYDYSLIP